MADATPTALRRLGTGTRLALGALSLTVAAGAAIHGVAPHPRPEPSTSAQAVVSDRGPLLSRSASRADQVEQDAVDQLALVEQMVQRRRAALNRIEAQADAHAQKLAQAQAKKQRQVRARAAARAAAAKAEAAAQAAAADADPGTLRAQAREWMLDYGFSADQWPALDRLVTRESGWSPTAQNPSSGAYGLPQSLPGDKMATVAADWRTNPHTQMLWMFGYIKDRYGTPNGAWAHSETHGWY